MADKKALRETAHRSVAQGPSARGTAGCRPTKPARPLVVVSLIALMIIAMLALPSCGRHSSSTGTDSEPSSSSADIDPKPSKYAVSIDGATLGYDYDGRPAIIVTYTWQNNSDREQMFLVALDPRCYQNGVELEHAFMVDGCDTSGNMAHIKPGSGNTVQESYLLKDENLPIDVEVREGLSLDDTILASATYSRE